MIDKISLTSPTEITPDYACKQLQGHFTHFLTTSTRYHNCVCVFYRGPSKEGEHLLSLHLEPKFFGSSPMKIDINPTRFRNFNSLIELLSKVEQPEKFGITRLDHAVDIEVPVEKLHRTLVFSRKKAREVYKDGRTLTGFYLGAYPELLAVYDKAKQTGKPGINSRVELRQFKNKVPISKLSLLPTLVNHSPFEKLQFNTVKDLEIENSLRIAAKAQLLKEAIKVMGAQGAFKNFNRHSNFKRDFGSLIEPDNNIPNLNEIYQNNLNLFFGGEVKHGFREATCS